MNLEEYKELKDKLESLKKQSSKAEALLETNLDKLRSTYSCNDLEEAELLITKFKEENNQLKLKIEQELEAFQQTWKDKLE